MKKIIAMSILGFLTSAYNRPPLADYRDAYTGTYSCKIYNSHLNSATMQYVLDTSRVNITVSKDAPDSVLQISLGGQILKAKLVNNVLQPYSHEGHYGGKFFAADSISLGFTPTMTSSLRYMGKKI